MILLLWIVVGLTAAGEIRIKNAQQSSTHSSPYTADRAIDGDMSTRSKTNYESNPWLRVYFERLSKVEKVIIEKGLSYGGTCTFKLSVYNRDKSTLCGTYTKSYGYYYNEAVQCGGMGGDSVKLEQTGCTTSLRVFEIKVYSKNCDGGYKKTSNGCVKCPVNTYTAGGTDCTKCSEGKESPEGSTNSTACTYVQCQKGYYEFNRTRCMPCLRGSYSITTGSSHCTNCPSGQTNLRSHSADAICYPVGRVVDCTIINSANFLSVEKCTLKASCNVQRDMCSAYEYCDNDGVCQHQYSPCGAAPSLCRVLYVVLRTYCSLESGDV